MKDLDAMALMPCASHMHVGEGKLVHDSWLIAPFQRQPGLPIAHVSAKTLKVSPAQDVAGYPTATALLG